MFDPSLGPHVRGAGRSDATAHPRTSRGRRPLRDGSGAALPDVVARRFQAFARPGECRTGPPQTRRARASLETGSEADAAGAGLGRGIPEVLEDQLVPVG